jgi:hypothetical protein
MDKQRTHQKKPAAPTRSHPTKTSGKSPVHQEDDQQGAIGNRQMGRLMETHPHIHPSSLNATMVGEMPMLGGMMPVSQGRIQRQPLFGGLSQEMRLENATLALPATRALVQRKLTLGTPGDMYEQEADRVARQVVDEIHSSPIREQNALSEEERIPAGGEAGRVQRQINVRSAGDAGGELSSEWEGQLQRAKSGGQPLSPSVKEPMERAFGADFGGVRVHTGAQADMLARSIQAKAFTTGQDVFFRQGAYEPGSRGGKELIAHELTHVVQQNSQTLLRQGKKESTLVSEVRISPTRLPSGWWDKVLKPLYPPQRMKVNIYYAPVYPLRNILSGLTQGTNLLTSQRSRNLISAILNFLQKPTLLLGHSAGGMTIRQALTRKLIAQKLAMKTMLSQGMIPENEPINDPEGLGPSPWYLQYQAEIEARRNSPDVTAILEEVTSRDFGSPGIYTDAIDTRSYTTQSDPITNLLNAGSYQHYINLGPGGHAFSPNYESAANHETITFLLRQIERGSNEVNIVIVTGMLTTNNEAIMRQGNLVQHLQNLQNILSSKGIKLEIHFYAEPLG